MAKNNNKINKNNKNNKNSKNSKFNKNNKNNFFFFGGGLNLRIKGREYHPRYHHHDWKHHPFLDEKQGTHQKEEGKDGVSERV